MSYRLDSVFLFFTAIQIFLFIYLAAMQKRSNQKTLIIVWHKIIFGSHEPKQA